jgi:hypothetical protein
MQFLNTRNKELIHNSLIEGYQDYIDNNGNLYTNNDVLLSNDHINNIIRA